MSGLIPCHTEASGERRVRGSVEQKGLRCTVKDLTAGRICAVQIESPDCVR